MGPASEPKDLWLAEWNRARDVVEKNDERLYDLRKYGLGFYSSILTASTLIGFQFSATASHLPALAASALLVTSLLVLAAVRVLDRQYQLLQQAAVARAWVLEVRSPIELSDFISDRARRAHWDILLFGLYLLLGAVAGLVGFALCPDSAVYVWVMVASLASYLVLLIAIALGQRGTLDWGLTTLTCNVGDVVGLLAANFSHKDVTLVGTLAQVREVGTTNWVDLPGPPDPRTLIRGRDTLELTWRPPRAGRYEFQVKSTSKVESFWPLRRRVAVGTLAPIHPGVGQHVVGEVGLVAVAVPFGDGGGA